MTPQVKKTGRVLICYHPSRFSRMVSADESHPVISHLGDQCHLISQGGAVSIFSLNEYIASSKQCPSFTHSLLTLLSYPINLWPFHLVSPAALPSLLRLRSLTQLDSFSHSVPSSDWITSVPMLYSPGIAWKSPAPVPNGHWLFDAYPSVVEKNFYSCFWILTWLHLPSAESTSCFLHSSPYSIKLTWY